LSPLAVSVPAVAAERLSVKVSACNVKTPATISAAANDADRAALRENTVCFMLVLFLLLSGVFPEARLTWSLRACVPPPV